MPIQRGNVNAKPSAKRPILSRLSLDLLSYPSRLPHSRPACPSNLSRTPHASLDSLSCPSRAPQVPQENNPTRPAPSKHLQNFRFTFLPRAETFTRPAVLSFPRRADMPGQPILPFPRRADTPGRPILSFPRRADTPGKQSGPPRAPQTAPEYSPPLSLHPENLRFFSIPPSPRRADASGTPCTTSPRLEKKSQPLKFF